MQNVTQPATSPAPYSGKIFAGRPGPYKLIGMESTEDRQLLNAQRESNGQTFTTNMCGGSCDHCGTAIWNVFIFRAADGSKFKMGEECADKLMYPSDEDQDYAARQAHRAYVSKKNECKRELKAKRDAAKIEAGKLWIEQNAPALAQLPHPQAWRAAKGETFLDSLNWLLAHAGVSGTLKAISSAYKALGYKPARVNSKKV